MRYTKDILEIMDKIRLNSSSMSKQHKNNYFYYKWISTLFRVPTIIISSISGVFSVGTQHYMNQNTISGIVCLLSLSISIINSIELFLHISDNVEIELEMSKKYYVLSCDLYKLLVLEDVNRPEDPKEQLKKYYSEYIDLYNESLLMKNTKFDKLINFKIHTNTNSNEIEINTNSNEIEKYTKSNAIEKFTKSNKIEKDTKSNKIEKNTKSNKIEIESDTNSNEIESDTNSNEIESDTNSNEIESDIVIDHELERII